MARIQLVIVQRGATSLVDSQGHDRGEVRKVELEHGYRGRISCRCAQVRNICKKTYVGRNVGEPRREGGHVPLREDASLDYKAGHKTGRSASATTQCRAGAGTDFSAARSFGKRFDHESPSTSSTNL